MTERKVVSVTATIAAVVLTKETEQNLDPSQYHAGQKVPALVVNPESSEAIFINIETGEVIQQPIWDYKLYYEVATLSYFVEIREDNDDLEPSDFPVFWRPMKGTK